MVGRYGESLKHLKAGLHLLNSQDPLTKSTSPELITAIFNQFSDIGIDYSILIEEHLVPPSTAQRSLEDSRNLRRTPFESFSDAAAELRHMDLMAMESMIFMGNPSCNGPSEAEYALEARFRAWGDRLDLTVANLSPGSISTQQALQVENLRLQQGIWLMSMHLDTPEKDQSAIDIACESFYQHAEPIARYLISLQRPTFSGDGDLIIGLSLVIYLTSDKNLQEEVCLLLEAMNRREGGWDSRDVAELHRAWISQENPAIRADLDNTQGLAEFIKMLCIHSDKITPDNGLLRLAMETDGMEQT